MGLLPASYFIWSADFAGGCLILFVMIVIDFITGMRAAQKQGLFSSGVAISKTKTKAVNYLTILLVGYLMNMFYLSLQIDGLVARFMVDLIGGCLDCLFLLFIGFLIGIEGYSILENLAKLGQKLPKRIVENWSKNMK